MPWRIRTGGVVGGPPIVADGVVYVPSADNLVSAVDAVSGNLGWTYRRIRSGRSTSGHPAGSPWWVGRCSSAASPLPGFFNGAVAAYPELEGDFLWWQEGPIGRIEGMAHAAGTLFVSGGRHLAAFDATNGAPPWQWRLRTSRDVRTGPA